MIIISDTIDSPVLEFASDKILAKKDFFTLGGIVKKDKEDRLYLSSYQASAVVDLLRLEIARRKVEEKVDTFIEKVSFERGAFKLFIRDKEPVFAEKVVVATGGIASLNLDKGEPYTILKDFGHTITPLYPSLVQLVTEKENLGVLKGVKSECNVKLIVDGNVVAEKYGDLLFTDYGVSGDSIFKLSAFYDERKESYLSVDFSNGIEKETIKDLLINKIKSGAFNKDLFVGIIKKQIGLALLKRLDINGNDKSQFADLERIIDCLYDFRIKVVKSMGFKNCQVTKGGARLSEFTFSLESKKQKGLFAMGEVLNVDGECGGFNLHFAFACASTVANKILKDL